MPTLDDLRPKKFQVTVRGVNLQCSPLRLSHALIIAKIGQVLENPKEAKTEDIRKAEADLDAIIIELIPELKDIKLDMMDSVELITQMSDGITPEDNKFLEDQGVKFDDGLKAPTTTPPQSPNQVNGG